MADIKDFFSLKNEVGKISGGDKNQTYHYLEVIKAFARATYKSIYVIDYQNKSFEYVADNPLFLCGNSAEEVKKMGYFFYFKYVTKPDLNLLLKINEVGFNFYEGIPQKERKEYTISYDFHIKNQEGKTILINQKLTPLFLTTKGKIWKAVCIISLSSERNAGNIKIYPKGESEIYAYDLEGNFWKKSEKVKLSNREKEILQLSTRGFTINEIAGIIFVSAETVKFHRRKLFDKLEVSNIAEAISYATNNKLI